MTGNILTINDKVIDKLIKYEIVYTKVWAEDTGRNMAGAMEGTMVGIFPTLQLELGACNDQEMAQLVSLFNRPFVEVTYYDTEYERYQTAQYYTDDVSISLKRQQGMRYHSYAVTLHPIRRR